MARKILIALSFVLTLALVATTFVSAQQAPAGAPAGAPGGGGQRGGGGGAPGGGGGGQRGGGGAAQAIKPVPGKTGLYMVTGAGGNTTVRVTNDGLVVVDTKNLGEPIYAALMEQIKTVSDKPVKFVVITHVHQDHSGNVTPFITSGAQVIAHENLITNLETYNPAQGKPGKPNVTYAKDYSVKLGTAEVARVYHFASGHTSGDSVVYFPDLQVVALGDELSTALNCDYGQGGSIPGWATSLGEVLKLNFDVAIAGHGDNPMTKADIQTIKTRLDSITKNAIDLVKKGTPKDQLVAAITAADATTNTGALLQNNAVRLDAFYDEISKLAK